MHLHHSGAAAPRRDDQRADYGPARFLIPVQGLLEIFGYFLLVLIGVELMETLKAYVKKDAIHIRVVLEVALIAMARKVIVEEPNDVFGLTPFGIAALILALALASYFERLTRHHHSHDVTTSEHWCSLAPLDFIFLSDH